jgi:thiosulfate dehydrogenase
MTSKRVGLVTTAAAVLVVATLAARPIALRAQQSDLPHHPTSESENGGVSVMLCDGSTSVEIEGVKPGEKVGHEKATAVARQLMAEWQRKHPGEHWEMAQAQPSNGSAASGAAASAAPMGSSQSQPAGTAGETKPQVAGVSASSPPPVQQGDTYASFHERDYKLWQAETQKFVDEGNRIFHSDKELGGTIGVSCDMCHPNAANTHPETYPKYQVQLQRVALLRDMINWCIENPVKGKAFDPNDRKLRALEAYILAQRKGFSLAYGKH